MQHAKVEMGAKCQTAMADNAQELSRSDWHPGRKTVGSWRK